MQFSPFLEGISGLYQTIPIIGHQTQWLKMTKKSHFTSQWLAMTKKSHFTFRVLGGEKEWKCDILCDF